jgi:hypothetical protein
MVLFTGMNLSPLEDVNRRAIDSSRLFTSISGVWRDDITGICYERDYSCIPVGFTDTSYRVDPADYSSVGVFQALTPEQS